MVSHNPPDMFDGFDKFIERNFKIFKNSYLLGFLTLISIMHINKLTPQLPNAVNNVFNYTIVKLLVFFLIAYATTKRTHVALITSIAFLDFLYFLEYMKFIPHHVVRSTRELECTMNPQSENSNVVSFSCKDKSDRYLHGVH